MGKLGSFELDSIVVGDCLEIAQKVPDECMDLVIADPPYGAKRPSAWRLATERFAEVENNDDVYTEWLREAFRVLKTNRGFYLFTCWQTMEEWRSALTKVGLAVRSCLVWDKGIHGLADIRTCYAPRHEFILYANKGRNELRGKRPVDIITCNRVPASRLQHPYQKPVDLISQLICHSTDTQDIVFDPFVGSGTTMVAAKKCQRHFFGCDVSEEYVHIANERVNRITETQLELL